MAATTETTVRIDVREADFDIAAELALMREGRTDIGAIASFIGLVREVSEGARVAAMSLEHYPGMTEKALAKIVADASARWPLQAVTVIHRVGTLHATDNIVLVLVASAHRHAAFDGCQFVMDFLKSEAPFWKKENTESGARWVDAKESDATALARWQ